jgi:hypothetical protein
MAVESARLQCSELFTGLTDAQREAIAARLEERTARPGVHLTSEGGGGYFFYVIEEGTAEVTRGDETLAELEAHHHPA